MAWWQSSLFDEFEEEQLRARECMKHTRYKNNPHWDLFQITLPHSTSNPSLYSQINEVLSGYFPGKSIDIVELEHINHCGDCDVYSVAVAIA